MKYCRVSLLHQSEKSSSVRNISLKRKPLQNNEVVKASLTEYCSFRSSLETKKANWLLATERKTGPIYHRLRQFAQARLANAMVVGVWSPEELPSPNPTVDHLGLCISTISMMELVWRFEVRA